MLTKPREDISCINFAEKLGYTIDYGKDKCFLVGGKLETYVYINGDNPEIRFKTTGDSYLFKKGTKHIWETRHGWNCADLLSGHFRNIRSYAYLSIALMLEN